MKKQIEYLSEAELESLILEIEQNELVPVLPDLQDGILEVLEQEKIIEYKRYRFRVLATVAAAVLVVFLLPRFESLQQQKTESKYMMQSRYETKEEALDDNRMLETILGGVNIFADNSRFNLFRE